MGGREASEQEEGAGNLAQRKLRSRLPCLWLWSHPGWVPGMGILCGPGLQVRCRATYSHELLPRTCSHVAPPPLSHLAMCLGAVCVSVCISVCVSV